MATGTHRPTIAIAKSREVAGFPPEHRVHIENPRDDDPGVAYRGRQPIRPRGSEADEIAELLMGVRVRSASTGNSASKAGKHEPHGNRAKSHDEQANDRQHPVRASEDGSVNTPVPMTPPMMSAVAPGTRSRRLVWEGTGAVGSRGGSTVDETESGVSVDGSAAGAN